MNRVRALIDVSAETVLTCLVNDFELPVLEEIHGSGSVTVASEEKVEPIGAEEAFNLLERRYTDKGLIRAVYRDARDLAAKTGLKLTGEVPVEARSLQVVAKPSRVVAKAQQAA